MQDPSYIAAVAAATVVAAGALAPTAPVLAVAAAAGAALVAVGECVAATVDSATETEVVGTGAAPAASEAAAFAIAVDSADFFVVLDAEFATAFAPAEWRGRRARSQLKHQSLR